MLAQEAVSVDRTEAHRHLARLAVQFRETAGYVPNWPAEQCAQRLAELSAQAGGALLPVIQERHELLPELPTWFLHQAVGPQDDQARLEENALWWLALVGWLEDSRRLIRVLERGVAYHREVFRMWRPNMQFHKHPFLSFHVGVCKAYGAGACRQSAAALDLLLKLLDQSETTSDNGPAMRRQRPQAVSNPLGSPAAQRYVGSRLSDTYHLPGCPMVRNINPRNLLHYDGPPVGKKLHDGCVEA